MRRTSEETDLIVSRIERLEAQNRRLKRGALACLIAIASMGLMGQAQRKTRRKPGPPPAPAPAVAKEIEAERFILKDSTGRARAELAMGATGPSFKLLDQGGSALVTLSLNDAAPGGPFLLLSDPPHRAGLSMSVLDGAGSQISLTGERSNAQARIGVTKEGTALELFDQDGFSTDIGNGVQLSKGGKTKNTSAASITLFNKDRKVLWSAP